jgi:hypothetical protein
MARDDHSQTDTRPSRQSCGATKGVNLSLGFVRVFWVVWIICCSALIVMSGINLALAAESLLLWLAMFGISAAALPAGLLLLAFFQKRLAGQLERLARGPVAPAAGQEQAITVFDRIWVGGMGCCFLGCGVWMVVRPQPWWLVEGIDLDTALLLGRIGGGLFILLGLVCLPVVFSRNRQPPDDRSRTDKHTEQGAAADGGRDAGVSEFTGSQRGRRC